MLPGYGARVEHNLGNNVNTPFLQVPTRELGQEMGAGVQGRDKKWVPGYTMYTRFLLGSTQSMVLHTHSFPLRSHFQLEQ